MGGESAENGSRRVEGRRGSAEGRSGEVKIGVSPNNQRPLIVNKPEYSKRKDKKPCT